MTKLEYVKDWQKKNWSRVLEYKRRWREKNPEKMSRARENWNKRNHERRRATIRANKRLKFKTDPVYRMVHNLRCALRSAVVHQKTYKTSKTSILVGITNAGLRKHIESLFVDGMSWDNYGQFGWHIDHIRPCTSFDLADPEQQRACFHYTNLRPLWWIDNQRKYNKHV